MRALKRTQVRRISRLAHVDKLGPVRIRLVGAEARDDALGVGGDDAGLGVAGAGLRAGDDGAGRHTWRGFGFGSCEVFGICLWEVLCCVVAESNFVTEKVGEEEKKKGKKKKGKKKKKERNKKKRRREEEEEEEKEKTARRNLIIFIVALPKISHNSDCEPWFPFSSSPDAVPKCRKL